ncbi:hypothetical protein E2C01_049921 [Portunus trituberculatus]|uniref:Uncharacterized protein n=1 Tax=Portunus trituberculatus TaxID=210409 RepID=A0A5B7GF55_PORTR|nr:hypothetical protein [Portunus trituberculatus]
MLPDFHYLISWTTANTIITTTITTTTTKMLKDLHSSFAIEGTSAGKEPTSGFRCIYLDILSVARLNHEEEGEKEKEDEKEAREKKKNLENTWRVQVVVAMVV